MIYLFLGALFYLLIKRTHIKAYHYPHNLYAQVSHWGMVLILQLTAILVVVKLIFSRFDLLLN